MKNTYRLGISVAAASAVVFSSVAHAQQQPDAGQLLQGVDGKAPQAVPGRPVDIEKPAPEPAKSRVGPKVNAKTFRVSGMTVYPEAELTALLDKYVGQQLDFDDLQNAADVIANHYKRNGYFLAHAYLPGQEIKDGVVTIAVLEGRVGQVNIRMAEGAKISEETARNFILENIKPGDLITDKGLEYGLLLLNDLPGADIKSTLVPGSVVGTADVIVSVGEGKRFSGQVEVDNYGQTTTGIYRFGAAANLNSPLGRGDQLAVRLLETDDRHLSYARVGYTLPVSRSGTRLGLAHTKMEYALGGSFAALGAHGDAKIDNYYALHPMYRTRNFNVFGQVGYDVKKLSDFTDSTSSKSLKSANNFSATLFGDGRDGILGGGMSTYSLAYTWGNISLDTASVKAIDQGAGGYKTHGGFDKGNVQLSRLQNVMPGLAFYAAYNGQFATKNLDTSEKMSLGGPTGVRAYPQGEASIDEGYLLSGELRFALGRMGTELPGQFSLAAFADGGRGRIHKTPLLADARNNIGRAGAGVGLTWGQPDDFLVRGTIAWRIGDKALADVDRYPRITFNAVKWF